MTFQLPADYYDPPEPCCEDTSCRCAECEQAAREDHEDRISEQADANRKERR